MKTSATTHFPTYNAQGNAPVLVLVRKLPEVQSERAFFTTMYVVGSGSSKGNLQDCQFLFVMTVTGWIRGKTVSADHGLISLSLIF